MLLRFLNILEAVAMHGTMVLCLACKLAEACRFERRGKSGVVVQDFSLR